MAPKYFKVVANTKKLVASFFKNKKIYMVLSCDFEELDPPESLVLILNDAVHYKHPKYINEMNFIKKDSTKIASFNSFKRFSNSYKNAAVLLPPRVVYIP